MEFDKEFYAENELTEEMIECLMKDPRYYRDQWGFHRRKSVSELKKMSNEELQHLSESSLNERDCTNAREELERRRRKEEQKKNFRDNIISGIIGAIVGILFEHLCKFIYKYVF